MGEQYEKLKKEAKRQTEAEENEGRRIKENKIRREELHQYEVEWQTICGEIVEIERYMS
jgi:hypothetical protein